MVKNQEKRKSTPNMKGIGLTTLGWEIAVPIFGGILLGYQLDRYLGLNYIFTISLLVFGIMIGYYNIYKRIELELLRTKAAKQKPNTNKKGIAFLDER